MKKMPNLHVGYRCRYYRGGVTTLEPFVGDVVKTNGKGTLDLSLISQNGPFNVARSIRHKDDPYWDDHQAVLKSTGCWDYLEGREDSDHETCGYLEANGKKQK